MDQNTSSALEGQRLGREGAACRMRSITTPTGLPYFSSGCWDRVSDMPVLLVLLGGGGDTVWFRKQEARKTRMLKAPTQNKGDMYSAPAPYPLPTLEPVVVQVTDSGLSV